MDRSFGRDRGKREHVSQEPVVCSQAFQMQILVKEVNNIFNRMHESIMV